MIIITDLDGLETTLLAINVDTVDDADNLGEGSEGSDAVVELATAVVAHDDPTNGGVHCCHLCTVAAQHLRKIII